MKNESPPRGIVPWHAIDTVILDMDGTLLDLNFDREVWNRRLPERFADRSGMTFDEAAAEVERRLTSARGTLDWYRLDYWHDQLGIDIGELEIELAALVRPRPGALAFLQRLHALPCRTILATNAHPHSMTRKFALTGIDRFFDVVSSSHDYGTCKESETFWPLFAADHAIDPHTSLLIDDNHNVLQAAAGFGIGYAFGVLYPDTLGPMCASNEFYCIESFEELLPEAAPQRA